jgi:hypothetical protein
MGIRLRAPMLLFAAGMLLYLAAAAVCVAIDRADSLTPIELLIPLFGLPFALLGRGPRWRTAFYLLLLVPGFQIAFGFFLSRLLRAPAQSGIVNAPGACPNPNGAP